MSNLSLTSTWRLDWKSHIDVAIGIAKDLVVYQLHGMSNVLLDPDFALLVKGVPHRATKVNLALEYAMRGKVFGRRLRHLQIHHLVARAHLRPQPINR
jgi:hypothetical protein